METSVLGQILYAVCNAYVILCFSVPLQLMFTLTLIYLTDDGLKSPVEVLAIFDHIGKKRTTKKIRVMNLTHR